MSQQMDVDFLFFQLMRQFGVNKIDGSFLKMNQFDREVRLLKFEVKETFIPFIGQLIFYDKILDKYSIHCYKLQLVSEYEDFSSQSSPKIVHSKQLIE